MSPTDSEDVTQGFFTSLLESEGLKHADPQRGRFRNFLVASLRNYLANHVRRENTQRRGGQTEVLSLDFGGAEERYQMEPLDLETPQQLFDRRWAMTLMENALNRVRELYTKSGKAHVFDTLKSYLADSEPARLQEIGAEWKMSETAMRVALHRLRKRCRDALRAEVARTLESTEDLDSELATLMDWVS